MNSLSGSPSDEMANFEKLGKIGEGTYGTVNLILIGRLRELFPHFEGVQGAQQGQRPDCGTESCAVGR